MVALNANQKKIQQMYSEKMGKAILMKDIHNVATRAKHQKVDSETTTCRSPGRVKNLSEWIKSQFPALHTTSVQDKEGLYWEFLCRTMRCKPKPKVERFWRSVPSGREYLIQVWDGAVQDQACLCSEINLPMARRQGGFCGRICGKKCQ